MAETYKYGWLTDYDGNKFAPYSFMNQLTVPNSTMSTVFVNVNQDNNFNLGNNQKFVYISNGIFQESTANVADDGTSERFPLMYLKQGALTDASKVENPISVGDTTKLIWLSEGKLIPSNGDVATDEKTLMYLSNGTLTPSDEDEGLTNQPVFLQDGKLVACGYNIDYTLSLESTTYDTIASITLSNGIEEQNTGINILPTNGLSFIALPAASNGTHASLFLSTEFASPDTRGTLKVTATDVGDAADYYSLELNPEGFGKVKVPWRNYYHTAAHTDSNTGLLIGTGSGLANMYVPYATDSQYGVVKTGYTTSGRNFAVQLSDGKMYVNVPSDNVDSYHTPTTPEVDESNGLKIAVGTRVGDLYVPIYARTTIGYAPGLVPEPGDSQGDTYFLDATGQWREPDYPSVTPSITLQSTAPNSYTAFAHGSYYKLQVGNQNTYFRMPTFSAATSSSLGGVKIGYSTSGTNYAVNLDSNNKMYVSVPWTDCKVTHSIVSTTQTNRSILVAGSEISKGGDVGGVQMHGSVYINTSSGCIYAPSLDITGSITASSFNADSDIRLKENFRPFIHNDILDLPVYKFDYINGLKNKIGCIAQDLQKICPEIVHEDDEGYLTIEENKIVYLLLDKMKEMQKEIDELKGV